MNDIYKLLNEQEGIKIIDDIFNNIYPTSIYSNDNDFVYVGRIRKDLSNDKALLISTVSDNLRKGAASNVVQIIKKLITIDWFWKYILLIYMRTHEGVVCEFIRDKSTYWIFLAYLN